MGSLCIKHILSMYLSFCLWRFKWYVSIYLSHWEGFYVGSRLIFYILGLKDRAPALYPSASMTWKGKWWQLEAEAGTLNIYLWATSAILASDSPPSHVLLWDLALPLSQAISTVSTWVVIVLTHPKSRHPDSITHHLSTCQEDCSASPASTGSGSWPLA